MEQREASYHQNQEKPRWRHALKWGAISLGALFGLMVLALHIPAAQTRIAGMALDGIFTDGSTLTIARVSGSPFGSLTATGVRLATPADSTTIQADTVHIEYNLIALIRDLHLQRVDVGHLEFTLGSRADGSLVFPGAGAPPDTTESTFSMALDEARIRRASGAIQRGDSALWTLGSGRLTMNDLDIDSTFSGVLDTLRLDMRYPEGSGSLAASGSLLPSGRTSLDLRLDTPRSQATLDVQGVLRPGANPDSLFADAAVAGSGTLSMADLEPFMAGVDPGQEITFNVNATGRPGAFSWVMDAEGSDGGVLDSEGDWYFGDEGIRVSTTTRVQSMSSDAYVDLESPVGVGGAVVEAEMSGPDWDHLTGAVNASVSGVQFQEYSAQSIELDLDLVDGQGSFRLETSARSPAPRPGTTASVQLQGATRPLGEERFVRWRGAVAAHLPAGADSLSVPVDLATATEGALRESPNHTWSTSASLTLQPTTIGSCRLESGQLDAQGTFSQLTLQLKSEMCEGGSLDLTGTMALMDESSSFELEGNVTALPIGSLMAFDGPVRADGRITADLQIPEQGSTELHATLDLTDVVATSVRLDSLVVIYKGSLQTGSGQMVAHRAGGTLAISPEIRRDQNGTRFQFDDGRMDSLDVSAVLADSSFVTDLNGTLSADLLLPGEGQSVSGSAQVELDQSVLNDEQIESARADVTFEGGALEGDLEINLEGGSLFAQVEMDPEANYRASGRMRSVNLPALLAMEGHHSDLTGMFEASLLTGGEVFLDFELEEGSTFNAFRIERAIADAGGSLDNLQGSLTLSGRRIPTPDSIAVERDSARVDATESDSLQRDLAAQPDSALAAGQRADPDSTTAELIAQDSMEVTVVDSVATDDVRADSVQANRFPEGVTGTLEMEFGVKQDSAFANAHFQGLDLAALAGLPDSSYVTSDLRARAQLGDSTWHEIQVDLQSLEAGYGSFAVDSGRGRIMVRPDLLSVDSLTVQGPSIALTAHGDLLLSGYPDETDSRQLTFDLDLDGEAVFLPVLSEMEIDFGNVTAEGSLGGPVGSRRLRAQVTGEAVRYQNVRANDASVTVLAELDGSDAISQAEATIEVRLIEVGTLAIEAVNSAITFDGEDAQTELEVRFDPNRTMQVDLGLDTGSDPMTLTIADMQADLDEEQWQQSGTATLTLGDPIALDRLIMHSGDSQVVVSSRVEEGQIRHLARLTTFEIGSIADLIGFDGLGGTVTGWFIAQPSESQFQLEGNIDADLTAFGEPVGPVHATVDLQDQILTLEADLRHEDGGSLTAQGSIPFADGSSEVDFTATADSYPIGWTRVFLDPTMIDRLDGNITGEITLGGTAAGPDLRGSLSLTQGRIGIPELGRRQSLRFTEIAAELEFEEDAVLVRELTARSGNGHVTGRGQIEMTELTLGNYDITLEASDFLAIDNASYRAVVSGSTSLQGTLTRPRLSGDLDVVSGDFHLTDETTASSFEPVTLTEEDFVILQRRFGMRIAASDTSTFDLYRALEIEDLTVQMERDTWVRSQSNPEMDIQITGNLDLSKEVNADPEVFGTIDVVPARSRIIQFGRRFNLESGTLTFNGPMGLPRLDLEATYTVPSRRSGEEEVTISLLIEGTPEELDVEFASEPAMELSDIVSYIATGRPASETLQVGNREGGYLQTAAGLAIGPVTDLVENLAATSFGLDVIEIENNELQGLTLTAGKYVSPKLYVSVSQPISTSSNAERSGANSENRTEVALEYEIVRQLLLSLLNRGTVMQINLRWEQSF